MTTDTTAITIKAEHAPTILSALRASYRHQIRAQRSALRKFGTLDQRSSSRFNYRQEHIRNAYAALGGNPDDLNGEP